MNSDILVRAYKPEDLEQVKEIMFDAFKLKIGDIAGLSTGEIRDVFDWLGIVPDKEDAGLLVADLDGQVMGCISLKWKDKSTKSSSFTSGLFKFARVHGIIKALKLLGCLILLDQEIDEDECYIESVAVSEKARGLGVGSLLISKGCDIAKALPGVTKYTLHVIGSNQGAKRLYDRIGFVNLSCDKGWLVRKLMGEECVYYMKLQDF